MEPRQHADPSAPYPPGSARPGGPSYAAGEERTRRVNNPATAPVALGSHASSAGVAMFGPYQMAGLLGEGGMGRVYLGRDPHLDRPVAIKTLRPELAANAVMAERFVREARSAAALAHPNIAQVYAAGNAQGIPYFVMEYVEGQTLKDIVKSSGPMPPDRALDCALQAARGLKAAAEKGIIHRDIKPGNLILDGAGVLKIADFGLAKNLARTDDFELTQEGMTVGSPYYMSPEQCAGETATIQSDIYSLGATLWYLLTGQPPFQAKSQAALAMKHFQEPLPRDAVLTNLRGGSIFRLLERMMAKQPGQRHPTYELLIFDLEALVAGMRPAGPRGDSRPTLRSASETAAAHRAQMVKVWVLLFGGILGLAMVVLGALKSRGEGAPAGVIPFSAPTLSSAPTQGAAPPIFTRPTPQPESNDSDDDEKAMPEIVSNDVIGPQGGASSRALIGLEYETPASFVAKPSSLGLVDLLAERGNIVGHPRGELFNALLAYEFREAGAILSRATASASEGTENPVAEDRLVRAALDALPRLQASFEERFQSARKRDLLRVVVGSKPWAVVKQVPTAIHFAPILPSGERSSQAFAVALRNLSPEATMELLKADLSDPSPRDKIFLRTFAVLYGLPLDNRFEPAGSLGGSTDWQSLLDAMAGGGAPSGEDDGSGRHHIRRAGGR